MHLDRECEIALVLAPPLLLPLSAFEQGLLPHTLPMVLSTNRGSGGSLVSECGQDVPAKH